MLVVRRQHNSMKTALIAVGITTVLFIGSCCGGLWWTFHVSDDEIVDFVTFGHGLPESGRVVGTQIDYTIEREYWFLIFDSDPEGIAWFAKRYSRGVSIDDLSRERPRGWEKNEVGTVTWNLAAIKNGRYFQHKGNHGFLSIDLTRNRVYVFRST